MVPVVVCGRNRGLLLYRIAASHFHALAGDRKMPQPHLCRPSEEASEPFDFLGFFVKFWLLNGGSCFQECWVPLRVLNKPHPPHPPGICASYSTSS